MRRLTDKQLEALAVLGSPMREAVAVWGDDRQRHQALANRGLLEAHGDCYRITADGLCALADNIDRIRAMYETGDTA